MRINLYQYGYNDSYFLIEIFLQTKEAELLQARMVLLKNEVILTEGKYEVEEKGKNKTRYFNEEDL